MQDFVVLRLADVYVVLTYYLQHRLPVEAYLRTRRETAQEQRQRLETQTDVQGLRARLQARQRV